MAKKLKVYNLQGEVVKEIAAPNCLETKVNPTLVSKYVRYLLQKDRESIANTKDRSEVSGGGRKPWRQKGTGNARAGSSRSPIWIGGGVTFGPTNEKTYTIRMNTKERKQALMMTLVDKLEKIIIIEELKITEPRTKKAVEILNKLPVENGKIMIFSAETKEENELAFRNLPFVSLAKVSNLNSLEIMRHDILIFDEAALNEMDKIYA